MKCSCGFTVPVTSAPDNHGCKLCGKTMKYEAKDLLQHGALGVVKETRVGQIQMASLVEHALEHREIAMIEAPTGVGKSFAAGIPALLSGKRVIISTAKKQLQAQLAHKDFPYLISKLGLNSHVVLMKGKSNYVCSLKTDYLAFAKDKNKNGVQTADREAFLKWAAETETGDLNDFADRRPPWANDFSAEDCIGKNCKYANSVDCAYWKTKQQSKTAQIVIANHHLVAFDLRFGPFKVLGPYDALIIDEAHQAVDAFRSAYSVSITSHSLRRVFRALDETGSAFAESGVLQDTWTEMFKRLSFRDGEIPKDPFGALGDTAIELLSDLYDQTGIRMKDEGITGTNEDDIKAPDRVTYQQLAAFQVLKRSIDKPLAALKSCKEPDDNTVIFAATDPKRNKKITVSPIELGPVIGPKLHTIGSVVITSATLSVGGNFDHVRRQLGLDIEMKQVEGEPAIPQTRIVTQSLESPFDYKRQAVLYTPKHIPLPVRDSDPPEVKETYYSALSNDIAQLINASKGNGFVLFSANTDLNEVHRRLEAEELAYPLILQGDNPNAAFKQYMATPNAVLLGVKSFWEGVDVQGEKLQLVIITKLPFGRPDDPVIQAQSRHLTQYLINEKGMSEANALRQVFQAVQTPKMITDVRQGGGRLIRSTTDRGVFAILDCRVWTGRGSVPSKTQNSYAGYGGQLVTALGFPSRTSSMLDVQGYFKDLHNSRKSE